MGGSVLGGFGGQKRDLAALEANGEARLRRHGACTAARTDSELALGKPVLEPAQIGQPAHTANISHAARGVKSPLADPSRIYASLT